MIVKDEEEMLPGALESVRPFVDEITVIDTGSTDRTRLIAEEHGARVFDFPWTGSFSDARNESLRRSPKGWTLIIDADDRAVGTAWRNLPELLSRQGRDLVVSPRYVDRTVEGRDVAKSYVPRIFYNDGRWVYRGLVHNRLEHRDEPGKPLRTAAAKELELVHYGYDPGIHHAKRKAERSMPLIARELEKDPESPLYRWYLARGFAAQGQLREALGILRSVLGLDGSKRADPGRYGRGPFHGAISTLAQVICDLNAEVEHDADLDALLAELPDHPGLSWAKARVLAATGRPHEAARLALRARSVLPEARPEWGTVRVADIEWQAPELAARQLLQMREYEAALEAYEACIAARPPEQPGWSPVLTNAAALAIELDRRALAEELLGRLVRRPDCHPGMFYFELDRRFREEGYGSARSLWSLAAGCSHLEGRPDHVEWRQRFAEPSVQVDRSPASLPGPVSPEPETR